METEEERRRRELMGIAPAFKTIFQSTDWEKYVTWGDAGSGSRFMGFESIANEQLATQLKEERENLIVGMQALDKTIMYYSDKKLELKAKLSEVEHSLYQLRPDSFIEGQLGSSSTVSRLIAKVENAIAQAVRENSYKKLSEFIIMMNNRTYHQLMDDLLKSTNTSFAHHSHTGRLDIKYKGLCIYRTQDLEDNEIIVK